jgi:hypothetical protein
VTTPDVKTEYTLTLNYSNGKTETRKVTAGATLGDLPEEDTGTSEIVGWSTVPTSLVEYEGGVSSDLTLYAIWKNYKVVNLVYAEDDTREEKVYEDADGKAEFPTATKENYVLDGWSATADGESSSVVFADLGDTYYAQWTAAYAISSLAGLQAIANEPSAYYYLTGNINMKSEDWTPIASFDGILEGNGYKIYNFTLSTTAPDANFGFFNVNNGVIQNLTFDDYTFNVTGDQQKTVNVGLLAGRNNGTIENFVLQNGSVSFDCQVSFYSQNVKTYSCSFGGLVGANYGSINNIHSTVGITGTTKSYSKGTYVGGSTLIFVATFYVGGLVGYNDGSVKGSDFQGSLTTTQISSKSGYGLCSYNQLWIGGLIGENSANSSCVNSYAKVTMTNSVGSVDYAYYRYGGFIGSNYGAINECYAESAISGGTKNDGYVGVFAGGNFSPGAIVDCHASGSVEATSGSIYVGGFVGQNEGKVQNSYTTATVSSTVSGNAGGFVGYNTSSGTISKSWSTGNVTVSSATSGLFAGSNAGVLNKDYYASDAVLTVNGEEVADESGLAVAKELSELQSRDLLFETLYWEEEYWQTVTNGNPILYWEVA